MAKSENAKRGTAGRRGPKSRNSWEPTASDELAARVGANLRRIRVAAGLTQVELAERTGIDRSFISQVEASTQRGMQSQTICNLANALGVSLDDLLAKT